MHAETFAVAGLGFRVLGFRVEAFRPFAFSFRVYLSRFAFALIFRV